VYTPVTGLTVERLYHPLPPRGEREEGLRYSYLVKVLVRRPVMEGERVVLFWTKKILELHPSVKVRGAGVFINTVICIPTGISSKYPQLFTLSAREV